jgi:hypothetical protein
MPDSPTRVLPQLGVLRRSRRRPATPPSDGDRRPTAQAKPPSERTLVNPSSGVWLGLSLAACGFLAIIFSWIRVAALVDVAQQMPYVVSGGMGGIGLVIVGVGIIDMAIRRQDRVERQQQIQQMGRVLQELRKRLQDGR